MQSEISASDLIRILNNVSFGLVRVKRDGKILPGFSYSMYKIFNLSEDDEIVGSSFIDLLNLEERAKQNFLLQFDTIFDDDLFAELSAASIGGTYPFHEKTLQLKATPIAETGTGVINSVLFVIEDITKSMEKENELGELRALLVILRNKAPLKNIIGELVDLIETNEKDKKDSSELQAPFRAILHNWKGSFGFLSMDKMVEIIHETENKETIVLDDFKYISEKLQEFLKKYENILNIAYKSNQKCEFSVLSNDLTSLVDTVKSGDPPSKRALKLIEDFVGKVTKVELGQLLEGADKMVERLAQRLDKKIDLVIERPETGIPLPYQDIVKTSVHMIRNSAYHGIEKMTIRQDKGKPELGQIKVSCDSNSETWNLIIEDDGAGIDIEKTKQKAIKLGKLSADKAKFISDSEACELVFLERLSTVDKVDHIAGRGMGMTNILDSTKQAQGKIDVINSRDKGCKFVITLPKLESSI